MHLTNSNDPKTDIVAYAAQWVGTKEVGTNDGWEDDVFTALMKQAGWLKDEAWCATFCRMIWLNVYAGDPIEPELRDILSKSVLRTYNNAKESKVLKVQQAPVVGGIVLWGTGKGRGHTGIIETVVDEVTVRTIEGNTNRMGKSEGDQVMRKYRPLQPRAKHLKWNYLGTIVPPDYGDITPEDLL